MTLNFNSSTSFIVSKNHFATVTALDPLDAFGDVLLRQILRITLRRYTADDIGRRFSDSMSIII